jgi:BirA family transcriptional regulator, biotin operon repressor / biotin---[acetyl-CoA-carboxylase] ligase
MLDLSRAADLIRERGIAIGSPLEILDETTSTNDVAKRAAKNGATHGATFVADSQTAGRGRQGRAWLSERGDSLLVSVVLRASCAPANLPPLSLVAGLAVCDAIAPDVSIAPKLKWPNDVWLDGKKVAGVLVEASLAGDRVESLIVGVGINVHTRAFPDEIKSLATSVALHSKLQPDRALILARLLEALDRDIGPVAKHGLGVVHARIDAIDALKGSTVRGELGEGIAAGIDTDGRLRVIRENKPIDTWVAGEVHLLK